MVNMVEMIKLEETLETTYSNLILPILHIETRGSEMTCQKTQSMVTERGIDWFY